MSILRQSLLGFLMFLIVMTMGHFVWGFIFEGPSPFMALAGNLWRPALWLLLHVGILVFVAYTTFHIWMMVRYGRTHKENNEWPPEEYTLALDEGGGQLKASKRSERRVGCYHGPCLYDGHHLCVVAAIGPRPFADAQKA